MNPKILQKGSVNYKTASFIYVVKVLHLFKHQNLLIADSYEMILISFKMH